MFIILIALGVFTIVLSRQNFLQKKYPLAVTFTNVGGLRDGDHVFLRGMQVGVVKETVLENDHVVVHSDLDVPVTFYPGYRVEIVDASLLGGKMMKIYAGEPVNPPLAATQPIVGQEPIEILDEFGAVIDSIRDMTDDIVAGEGTLGKLFNDEDLYNNLQTLTANLQEVSERLVDGKGTLGRLLSEDEQLYQDIQASASNIRSITEKIETGGGTLGRLVEDDQIYVEAQKLLAELRAAIDDMRETSPVTTFSSVFFGAF